MKEDFVYEGLWSFALNDEKEYFGRLIYNKKLGIKLELRGRFDIFEIQKLTAFNLYGLVDHLNISVTLEGCWVTHHGYFMVNLEVNKCFFGHLLESPDRVQINSGSVVYFGLQDYIQLNNFDRKSIEGEEIIIKYNNFPKMKMDCGNLNISLMHTPQEKHSKDHNKTGEHKVTLREFIAVHFDYKEAVPLNEYMNDVHLFAFLISICSNKIIYPNELFFTTINVKKIEYVFVNPIMRNDIYNYLKEIIPFDSLNIYDFVENGFKHKEMLRTFVHYKQVSDQYYHHYNENRFLDSLVVLETFFRSFKDNSLDKSLVNTIDKILTSDLIPDDQMDFFKTRFQGGKSNKKKYLELYRTLPKYLNRSIADKIYEYCSLLVDTRNAFTHNDRKGRSILRNDNMENATFNNETLSKLLIIQLLGFQYEINEDYARHFFKKIKSLSNQLDNKLLTNPSAQENI